MKSTLRLDLTDFLDESFVKGIDEISIILHENNYQFFLVGALARDIILNGIYKLRTSQTKTKDIDFGIYVENWNQYSELLKLLESKYSYSKTNNLFTIRKNDQYIDLIPFGELINEDGILKQEPGIEMSIPGFNEVFEYTLKLRLRSNLIINILSVEGFIILKFFSWRDRKEFKDIQDLAKILMNYDIKTSNIMYNDEYNDLLMSCDIDELNMRILGREIYKILRNSKNCLKQITEFLHGEINKDGTSIFITSLVSYGFMNSYKKVLDCLIEINEEIGKEY
ncbi:MAG: hypothetical protein PHV06_01145 [bacterium]|nr:hypothetical protein [bacterium]